MAFTFFINMNLQSIISYIAIKLTLQSFSKILLYYFFHLVIKIDNQQYIYIDKHVLVQYYM
jgi:hypothetical protein